MLVLAVIACFSLAGCNADRTNRKVLEQMEAYLPPRSEGIIRSLADSEMPTARFESRDYVGILTVEGYGIELPVLKSDTAGSAYDGTLRITSRAVDFSCIDEIDEGENLAFTDMRGSLYSYSVVMVKHSDSKTPDSLPECDLSVSVYSAKISKYVFVCCKLK